MPILFRAAGLRACERKRNCPVYSMHCVFLKLQGRAHSIRAVDTASAPVTPRARTLGVMEERPNEMTDPLLEFLRHVAIRFNSKFRRVPHISFASRCDVSRGCCHRDLLC